MFVDAQILISFNSDQQSFDEGYNHLTYLYTSNPPPKKKQKQKPNKQTKQNKKQFSPFTVRNFCHGASS